MRAEDRGLDQARDTNLILAVVFLLILALVFLLRAMGTGSDLTAPQSLASTDPAGSAAEELSQPGTSPMAPPEKPPRQPAQWGVSGERIPFAQWWSSFVSENGTETVWSNPLATQINKDGLIAVDSPQSDNPLAWDSSARFKPALFLDAGGESKSTKVVGYGDFHVKSLVSDDLGNWVELTLVQGNPFLELKSDPNLSIHVPGLKLGRVGDSYASFEGLGGEWVLVSSLPVAIEAEGDLILLSADADFGLVLARAFGDIDELLPLASEIVSAPVNDTIEELSVAADGKVTQELTVKRTGGTDSIFALLPHQSDRLAALGGRSQGTPAGQVSGALGIYPTIATNRLILEYPAVPIIWDFISVGQPIDVPSLANDSPPLAGSYFGGKEALRLAQKAQLSLGVGDLDVGEHYLDRVEAILHDLISLEGSNRLSWDTSWGSVIIEPAEFGSGQELNDHSLQYGYWVSAASIYAQHRPDSIDGLAKAVELLIDDYGGTLEDGDGLTQHSTLSTWSAYEGHSWASGTVPFSAGNNLESTSESTHAWWAAARWYVVNGEPELAEPFLARFTIETSLVAQRWLPHEVTEGDRPWSGVVWSASIDEMTWFDKRPEAALGIKLLPLTPASLARYATSRDREAAVARWDWCDANGGCRDLWPNLLDSDAAVAGRPPLEGGGQDETSTPEEVLEWWRGVWAPDYSPSEEWSCGAGVMAMTNSDGSTIYLGSNPGPVESTVVCQSEKGRVELSIGPGEDLGS